jgi:serine/threonine-protein kinase
MTDLTGRLLGRYRLESLLGRGGMAEVWRAADTKLARTVAVKVIHASVAQDPQFAERFLREARVVASLEHPGILPVYDFGEEDGIPFLVMPHLPGGTLRDRLRGAPAPVGLAAGWIRQLADALDAAHAAGVLHRDVKPANVLIGRDERLFLADFGIAKMVESMTGLTATGAVVGTPVYMAPEQAQGHPASPATDRYALAVVVYEILAGRPPFDGDNPFSLMHQHVSTPPPALSSRAAGLPAGLDAVLAGALSKDPAGRPPTCRALADAVTAFLPAGATPPPASAAWPTPPGGATSPTVLQGPTAATTPLTGAATVVTAAPRPVRRRGLAWGAAGLAVSVAVAAVFFSMKAKRDADRAAAAASAPTPVPTPAPALPVPPPAAPVAAVGSPVPTPDTRIAELEKRVKDAEAVAKEARAAAKAAAAPAIPAPPPAPTAASAPDTDAASSGHGALAAVRERLEIAKKPSRRLSKDDFQFALDTSRRVAAEHPRNADARAYAAYGEGGLAYVAGNDTLAGARAVEAFQEMRRADKQEHRALGLLLTRPDGTVPAPRGWELAMAYGDARGEAMALLDAAVRDDPRDLRAQRARAALRRLHGLAPDGPEPRRLPNARRAPP